MRSAFYRAVVRCRLRRLEQVACAAPLPALAATVAVAAAPFLLWRAGAAVGNGLATAIGSPAVANALVLGPALAAAAAGVVVTVSLPGRSALGAQLSASPCRRGDAIVAGLLVPAGLFAIVVLPSLVAVCVALAEPLPGGAPAGLALVVACLAAVPTGGIVVEGVFGLLRRGRRAVGFATGLVVSWPLAGSVAGAAPLGPLAPVARALEGSSSAGGAFAAAALVAVGLGAVWLALVACRPAPRSRRTRRTRALVGGGASLAIPTAGAVILARRTDVRVATAASLGFGLAGVVVADASSGGVSPFLLATTTTLFGSIVPSLAVGGVIASGRWLWLRRRPGPTGVAATTGVVGIAGSAVPVVVVGLAAAGASDATRAAVGFVAAVVVLGASSALLAGALVPWRPVGIGDQLTTFAALGAVAIALSLVLGLAGPRLTGIGVPAAVVVVAAASLSVVVAVLALIADTDRLCLAPGVEVSGGRIVDAVRGASWPLNPSGEFVLSSAHLPLAQVVLALADSFAIPAELARRDVFRFALSLNALALANVERRGSRLSHAVDWLRAAARLVPAGTVPGTLGRRFELDTRTISRSVAGALSALLQRIALLAIVTALLAAQVAVVGGTPGLAGPVALGLGVGLALGLHETAHILVLRGVASALVLRGRRTFVLHAPLGRRRRSLVAVAGPTMPVVLGLAIVSSGVGLGRSVLVVLGLPLVSHALALTVVGGDGRTACGL